MRFTGLLLAFSFLAVASVAQAQTPVPNPPPHFNAVKIVLVGDSTTAVQGGWGPSFCAKHVTSFAACINLARGGRSSGNYRTEGSWALALNEIKSGGFNDTYVLVQFGHNDQPGKPGRSTDLATEFPANLKAYVDEIRAAGGKPVLVTPLTRRQFKDGKLIDDLAPWAEATRKVAAETGAPLTDGRGRGDALRPERTARPRAGRGSDRHDDRRQHPRARSGRASRDRSANRAEQRRRRADGPGQAVVRLHAPGRDGGRLFRHPGHDRPGQGGTGLAPVSDPLNSRVRRTSPCA
jgi:hypothetical protein